MRAPTFRAETLRRPPSYLAWLGEVVLVVPAWEKHFQQSAMEDLKWGDHRLSQWTRENADSVAFYRVGRKDGPSAITHAASLREFYPSWRGEGYWEYTLARQPEELPHDLPGGEKWIRSPRPVTADNLVVAWFVDHLAKPIRD